MSARNSVADPAPSTLATSEPPVQNSNHDDSLSDHTELDEKVHTQEEPPNDDARHGVPAVAASSSSTIQSDLIKSDPTPQPVGQSSEHKAALTHFRPVVTPLICLVLGAVLALGHHLFNSWADGRTVGRSPNIPQGWFLRVGTAFAFTFQAIIAASISFTICQVLWYYARRKYMTLQDFNTLYLIERRDFVPTILSNAIARAPLLVLLVAVTLMLPIAAIFSPASLSVVNRTTTSTGDCSISAAKIADGWNSTHIYSTDDGIFLSGLSGPALKVAQRALVGGVIPSLPTFCGDNCLYNVGMDSMTFQCEENVTLPVGQMGTVDPAHPGPGTRTYWNATSDGSDSDPTQPFYVGWRTDAYTDGMAEYLNGTSGSAHCTPMLAHYNFTVQKINGVQLVSYTTEITGSMPPSTHYDANNDQPTFAALQIGAIGLAARNYLIGSLSVTSNPMTSHESYNSSVISASFLNLSTIGVESYVWGDVVGGIQETAANITASMLLLNLGGLVESTCDYTSQELVYSYSWLGLWIPYGIALLIAALSLILGILIFIRFNPHNLTTSLSDTIRLTQNPDLKVASNEKNPSSVASTTKFKLGEQADGGLGFTTRNDFT